MESPRRESGQVRSCSQLHDSLLFGVLVEKLRTQSVLMGWFWRILTIRSGCLRSCTLATSHWRLRRPFSLLRSFLLSFYCFCGAWYSKTMAP